MYKPTQNEENKTRAQFPALVDENGEAKKQGLTGFTLSLMQGGTAQAKAEETSRCIKTQTAYVEGRGLKKGIKETNTQLGTTPGKNQTEGGKGGKA